MSNAIFQRIDLNKDKKIDFCEWSEALAKISDDFDQAYESYVKENGPENEPDAHSNLSVGNRFVIEAVNRGLGTQLCPDKYLGLLINSSTIDKEYGCEPTLDGQDIQLTFANEDGLTSFSVFRKFASQDWWGEYETKVMSEYEFNNLTKSLNDPCRP